MRAGAAILSGVVLLTVRRIVRKRRRERLRGGTFDGLGARADETAVLLAGKRDLPNS